MNASLSKDSLILALLLFGGTVAASFAWPAPASFQSFVAPANDATSAHQDSGKIGVNASGRDAQLSLSLTSALLEGQTFLVEVLVGERVVESLECSWDRIPLIIIGDGAHAIIRDVSDERIQDIKGRWSLAAFEPEDLVDSHGVTGDFLLPDNDNASPVGEGIWFASKMAGARPQHVGIDREVGEDSSFLVNIWQYPNGYAGEALHVKTLHFDEASQPEVVLPPKSRGELSDCTADADASKVEKKAYWSACSYGSATSGQ